MNYNNRKRNNNFKQPRKEGDNKAVVVSDTSEFGYIQPIQAKHLEVIVHLGSFDRALRAFRALVQKERILSIYKEKQTYEKPSDKNRRKRNEMKRKRLELENPRPPREPKKSYKRKPKSEDTTE